MQKRDREDDFRDLHLHPAKRQRVFFQLPENGPVLSGDESSHSMQGWETELCQDTPDTNSDSESLGSPSSFMESLEEYEVDSLSEVEKPFDTDSSASIDTSSEDKNYPVKVAKNVEGWEDEAFWGDNSHSDLDNSSTDKEIPKSDNWRCPRCKCVNKPPLGLCSMCFQVRKNWFPPRPRKNRKKKAREKIRNVTPKLMDMVSTVSTDVTDSGLGSFSKNDDEEDKSHETVASTCTLSIYDKPVPSLERSKSVSSGSDSDKCITCLEQIKNAAFVHGNSGHISCCYKCAKTEWSRSGKCPVCNRKLNRILKLFYA